MDGFVLGWASENPAKHFYSTLIARLFTLLPHELLVLGGVAEPPLGPAGTRAAVLVGTRDFGAALCTCLRGGGW